MPLRTWRAGVHWPQKRRSPAGRMPRSAPPTGIAPQIQNVHLYLKLYRTSLKCGLAFGVGCTYAASRLAEFGEERWSAESKFR